MKSESASFCFSATVIKNANQHYCNWSQLDQWNDVLLLQIHCFLVLHCCLYQISYIIKGGWCCWEFLFLKDQVVWNLWTSNSLPASLGLRSQFLNLSSCSEIGICLLFLADQSSVQRSSLELRKHCHKMELVKSAMFADLLHKPTTLNAKALQGQISPAFHIPLYTFLSHSSLHFPFTFPTENFHF